MHPREHYMAILDAVTRLEQVGVPDEERTTPTRQDLKLALPTMNEREFNMTMGNLTRRGRRNPIRVCNTISVPYACKPVAVFALYNRDAPRTMPKWCAAVSVWSKPVEARAA